MIGICLTATASALTADTAREQAWRSAIARTPVPFSGCFTANYPVLVWHQIRCTAAPKAEFSQMHGTERGGRAGGSNDYLAETKSLTSTAVGSFPAAKHLKSEQGPGGANDYSIQLNSNFISKDRACAGSSTPQFCVGWEQFVFSNLYQNAYMQYWLVYYNSPCPAGWNAYPSSGNCWKNSNLVPVPEQAITQLPNMSMSGAATASGNDTLILTIGAQAYSTTGSDKAVYLAKGWHGTEFNVFGSGSAEAVFNAGASLTGRIELTDGSTKKPVCQADAGTTLETNNLTLGPCKTAGGSVPAIQFVETAPSP
jgi:hypothetical protein